MHTPLEAGDVAAFAVRLNVMRGDVWRHHQRLVEQLASSGTTQLIGQILQTLAQQIVAHRMRDTKRCREAIPFVACREGIDIKEKACKRTNGITDLLAVRQIVDHATRRRPGKAYDDGCITKDGQQTKLEIKYFVDAFLIVVIITVQIDANFGLRNGFIIFEPLLLS